MQTIGIKLGSESHSTDNGVRTRLCKLTRCPHVGSSRAVHRSCVACERAPPAARAPLPMERAAAELRPRAGASPGLLRRRYSVPETIMRK